jgi:hypothetical protein
VRSQTLGDLRGAGELLDSARDVTFAVAFGQEPTPVQAIHERLDGVRVGAVLAVFSIAGHAPRIDKPPLTIDQRHETAANRGRE